MSDKNGGKVSRDALAAEVNDTVDRGAKYIGCRAQIAADVIEQRDDLLKAAEAALEALINYAGVNKTNPQEWFKIKHAKLYAAIALAKGN